MWKFPWTGDPDAQPCPKPTFGVCCAVESLVEPGALLVLAKAATGAAWQEAAAKEQCAPVLSLMSSGDMLVASMSRAAAASPMTEDDAAAAEVPASPACRTA